MANSTGDVIERWVREVGKENPKFLSANHTNIAYDSKQLYSYGFHFPMARLIGDRDTGWFLVNGDLYSVSTSRHQGDTRWAIKRSGIKSMTVPFSALREAGIDLDSIVPVEITDDWNETLHYSQDEWDKLPRWLKYKTVTSSEVLYRTEVCKNGPRGSLEPYSWDDGGKLVKRDIRENDYPGTLHFIPYTHYSYDQVKTEPGEDGLWHWERTAHHLGQAVFKARYQCGTKPVRHWRMSYDRDAMYKRMEQREREAQDRGETYTGGMDWQNPIERRVYYTENQPVYDTAYFLSGYDEQERGRTGQGLYFLAQLPADAHPTTVDEAFECLKPAEVREAEKLGLDVVRQGDVYAIESHLRPGTLKAMGAERPEVDATELQAVAYQNARLETERQRRIDYARQDWQRQYDKLTELAREAFHECENGHELVEWQGTDPCWVCGRVPESTQAVIDLPPAPEPESEIKPLTRIKGMGKTERWVLGVNHTASDVLVSPAGTTWGKGTLRHKRLTRTWEGYFAGLPEHKRVRMGDGKTWYRLVTNTVPEGRSWTVGGGVD